MMSLGMAIGGVSASTLIRPGREKWPMTLVPIIFAPAIAGFSIANQAGAMVLSVLTGIGRTPIREALQRLAREKLVSILPRPLKDRLFASVPRKE